MDYSALAKAFVEHHQTAIAFLVGMVVSHPAKCADLFFAAAMKTPFSPLILKYAPAFFTWLDTFRNKLKIDVDAELAKEASTTPPPTPPTTPA